MVSIGKRERMLIIKGEKMSKNDEKRIDVIKSVFANVRKKKLEKKLRQKTNRKTALIRTMRSYVWLDTYATYPARR
jgi:hypothetical protein